jgi:small subunit ribosomal protein S8
MVSTDPIADMLTRVRNGADVRKEAVAMPHSNVKEAVAKILSAHKFVGAVEVVKGATGRKELVIALHTSGNAYITEIKRLSTPGRRMYASADSIPTVKGGRGIVVISTSKGIMTGNEAKKLRLGGELICQVY